eukprot:TRINITY_DN5717_c0_g1_i2.p1 TRINITY_DN5717_c0_g1~~TRINITY_DN5717_c0_g1_i2.p1  ORF type:complete len:235 (+),score=24.99 TRINITY_DN5717_c0_g1_i2:526-1230(+)
MGPKGSATCQDPCSGIWPPRLQFCDAKLNNSCPHGSICQGCTPTDCKCVNGKITECKPNCKGSCYLGEGSICKSGGIETGLGVNRVNDCAKGLVCLSDPNNISIGGEVKWRCQRRDPCYDWNWPPPHIKFCSTNDMCTEPGEVCWQTCTPSNCGCMYGKKHACTEDCRSTCVLGAGAVCKSGGVESGVKISRTLDCRVGLVCRPKGCFAIGGEIDWTAKIHVSISYGLPQPSVL